LGGWNYLFPDDHRDSFLYRPVFPSLLKIYEEEKRDEGGKTEEGKAAD